MLCVNPCTGAPATAAPPTENLGALRPSEDFSTLSLEAGKIGARCDKGLLLIGPPPLGFGRYVLPGNNFHIYDYALFWANLRADAEARAASFAKRSDERSVGKGCVSTCRSRRARLHYKKKTQ